jgi:hypothetical protein
MLFYDKNGVQRLKTLNNPIRPTAEQRFYEAMIDQAVDESLRSDSYYSRNTETDVETILQARADITSPWFEAACMSAYGIDSSAIVELLQDLWESAGPVEMERVRKNYAHQSHRWAQAMAEGQRKRTMEEYDEA